MADRKETYYDFVVHLHHCVSLQRELQDGMFKKFGRSYAVMGHDELTQLIDVKNQSIPCFYVAYLTIPGIPDARGSAFKVSTEAGCNP